MALNDIYIKQCINIPKAEMHFKYFKITFNFFFFFGKLTKTNYLNQKLNNSE